MASSPPASSSCNSTISQMQINRLIYNHLCASPASSPELLHQMEKSTCCYFDMDYFDSLLECYAFDEADRYLSPFVSFFCPAEKALLASLSVPSPAGAGSYPPIPVQIDENLLKSLILVRTSRLCFALWRRNESEELAASASIQDLRKLFQAAAAQLSDDSSASKWNSFSEQLAGCMSTKFDLSQRETLFKQANLPTSSFKSSSSSSSSSVAIASKQQDKKESAPFSLFKRQIRNILSKTPHLMALTSLESSPASLSVIGTFSNPPASELSAIVSSHYFNASRPSSAAPSTPAVQPIKPVAPSTPAVVSAPQPSASAVPLLNAPKPPNAPAPSTPSISGPNNAQTQKPASNGGIAPLTPAAAGQQKSSPIAPAAAVTTPVSVQKPQPMNIVPPPPPVAAVAAASAIINNGVAPKPQAAQLQPQQQQPQPQKRKDVPSSSPPALSSPPPLGPPPIPSAANSLPLTPVAVSAPAAPASGPSAKRSRIEETTPIAAAVPTSTVPSALASQPMQISAAGAAPQQMLAPGPVPMQLTPRTPAAPPAPVAPVTPSPVSGSGSSLQSPSSSPSSSMSSPLSASSSGIAKQERPVTAACIARIPEASASAITCIAPANRSFFVANDRGAVFSFKETSSVPMLQPPSFSDLPPDLVKSIMNRCGSAGETHKYDLDGVEGSTPAVLQLTVPPPSSSSPASNIALYRHKSSELMICGSKGQIMLYWQKTPKVFQKNGTSPFNFKYPVATSFSSPPSDFSDYVSSIDMYPNNANLLVVGLQNGSIEVANVKTKAVFPFYIPSRAAGAPAPSPVCSIAFAGPTILIAGFSNGSLRRFNFPAASLYMDPPPAGSASRPPPPLVEGTAISSGARNIQLGPNPKLFFIDNDRMLIASDPGLVLLDTINGKTVSSIGIPKGRRISATCILPPAFRRFPSTVLSITPALPASSAASGSAPSSASSSASSSPGSSSSASSSTVRSLSISLVFEPSALEQLSASSVPAAPSASAPAKDGKKPEAPTASLPPLAIRPADEICLLHKKTGTIISTSTVISCPITSLNAEGDQQRIDVVLDKVSESECTAVLQLSSEELASELVVWVRSAPHATNIKLPQELAKLKEKEDLEKAAAAKAAPLAHLINSTAASREGHIVVVFLAAEDDQALPSLLLATIQNMAISPGRLRRMDSNMCGSSTLEKGETITSASVFPSSDGRSVLAGTNKGRTWIFFFHEEKLGSK